MDYMKIALDLARKAQGTTSPNPPVGAVIVKDGLIVGEGFTLPPGEGHAEAVALRQAGERAKGATLYTTLEPCCIYGRVPPCTQVIIPADIKEVHIATRDPNPRINNKGLKELEEAGIRVLLGEHQEEALQLYEAFAKYILTGIPFVVAKFAMSLDGKTATYKGDSRWITGEEARARVQELRYTCDAIVVGVNTVKVDDPLLTARDPSGRPAQRQPLRVVVDSQATTPTTARLLKEPGTTLIATTRDDCPEVESLTRAGAQMLKMPSYRGKVSLRALLEELGRRDVVSLVVEGGGTLLASFIQQGLVDKVLAFIAPVIIGGKRAPTPVDGRGVALLTHALQLNRIEVERVGQDILVTGYPKDLG